jgi:hypothetical protein
VKVRVLDNTIGNYFKSVVYAKINCGWYEKQLVHAPSENGGYIRFFDYLDKSKEEMPPNVNINTIIADSPNEWIREKSGSVDNQIKSYEKLLNKNVRFFEYIGYAWLYENMPILAELLNGNSIPYKGSIFENSDATSEISAWTYIETQEDADRLFLNTHSFHDSVLKTANYISGAFVNPDGSMHPVADTRQVTMCIDSQLCDPIEMVFDGVTAFNLRPAGDNYAADISSASLFVKNASIFFCDYAVKEWDEKYEGTWISAYSLRWHFVR